MLTRFMQRAIKAPAVRYPAFALQGAQAEAWMLPSYQLPEAQNELYQRLSWVQIAVRTIADTVATAGAQVMRQANEKNEQVTNHPFEVLLQRPNPLMSRFALLAATASYFKLTGNAYWWLNKRSQSAPPDEVWLIPSHNIRPVPDERLYLRGYEYDAGQGQKLLLPVDAVCHFKTFNPLSQFVGLSAIEALAGVAVGDMAMQKWNTNYFDKNNAKLPGALTFAQMVPDATWSEIQAQFKREYGGTERNLLMLRGVGDNAVSWVQMASSQKDMEFLAGRQSNKEEIYTAFGVPPGLLDKNATEANATAAKAVFSEMTLWPLLVALSETITNTILPAYGPNLVLAFDDPRKTDRALELQEQAEYARTHTIDEVREKFYEDAPIGDERGKLLIAEITPGGIPGVDVPEKPAPIIMPPGAQAAEEEGGETEDEDEQPAENEPTEDEDERLTAEKRVDTGRQLDDLRAWRRKCKARGEFTDFVSEAISPGLRARIVSEASQRQDIEHVKAVFDAIIAEVKALRIIPDGATEPLPPVPAEVEISESDIERATALWDELMPEYAGLLNAENTGKVPNAE
jgi:HK97 family phage portal protein